ncbi:hypothetical protein VKT23_007757 [Stygiomarasmius scandens]|uniref:F-box domain-containing protein n=1 Tax=Marasmiellus scandens TaxID=2682957 RepID=A0ABR1JMY5_9AGAR
MIHGLQNELVTLGKKYRYLSFEYHQDSNADCVDANLISIIMNYRGVLSPLRRLPFEILSEIFLVYAEALIVNPDLEGHEQDRGRGLAIRHQDLICQAQTGRSGPSVLAGVCRKWRSVALATPHLWSQIVISPESLSPTVRLDYLNSEILRRESYRSLSRDKIHRLFERRVKYSASLPLNISMHYEKRAMSPVTQRLFKLIMSTANRWGSIRLNMPITDIPENWISMPRWKINFQHLRNVDLVFSYASGRTPNALRHWFENAPNLTSVRWLRPLLINQESILTFSLPWEQLTHLEVDLSDEEVLVVLQRCKRLRNFKYHSDDNVIPWDGPSSMVHDTLESLSVLNGAVSWSYPRDGLETVLKNVSLPVLKNLTIEGPPPMRQFVSNNPTQYVDARLSSVLIIFIQHSQPLHLTTLTLNSISVDKGFLDMIVQVSGTCSALSRVELDIRHLAGDTIQGRSELAAQFIALLTVPGSSVQENVPAVLPRLKEFMLKFRCLTGDDEASCFSIDSLTRMVRSRRDAEFSISGVNRLEKFGLDYSYWNLPWVFKQEHVKQLRDLENDEFNLDFPERDPWLKYARSQELLMNFIY